ncbi:ATP-binding protein [Streptacidiphilus pinicola]|uniref:ATP-binding protein n=1 Tax=Streptacidiphilus pinicola TaxID=2219663 RepID=UPI001402AFFD|nr:ATP-binding protein [Streptacidiphilus pinicola]
MQGLLEREDELDIIQAAVGALRDEHSGDLLIVTGAAGLGKTSLLAAVQAAARSAGLLVLAARGGEREQGTAFHVVRGLLEPLLGPAEDAERRELLGGWHDIVGAAVGVAAGRAAPDPQGVRDGLDWVVTNLAFARGPLVLVVDDAHWADAESLTWLAGFAARVTNSPILVAVAYRPDELPDWADEFRRVGDDNGASLLGLPPLTPEGVDTLVRELYPDGSGTAVEDAFCRDVWAVAGGNPFETVELVGKARNRGIAPVESSWPELRRLAAETTGSGLIARLQQLGSGPLGLARAVAVLGMVTPLQLAGDVAGHGPTEARAALDVLRRERVLTGHQILEFVHPLIATSVYRDIPDEERTALHQRSARALLEAGRSPVVAARHWLEVPPRGDARVVEHLREAARLFMQAGAPEAAQRCLARAVEEPPPVAERARVLFELGCSTLLYDPALTSEHLRAALEQPVIPTHLREQISVRLAQSLAHSDDLARAAAIMRTEASRATDPAVWLKMQLWNFMWGAFDAREEGSRERSVRLAELAERLYTSGDRSIAARYVLGLRAWDATVRGEPVDLALRYSDRALEGELRWAHPEWGFEVPVLVALTYMYGDRRERALELFGQGIAEYEQAGWRGAHLAFGHTVLGFVHYRTGDLADAEGCARWGLELADRVGTGTPVHWYAGATMIAVLNARGKADEARALAARCRLHAPYPNAVVVPDPQTVRGALLLEQGAFAAAEAEMTQAAARLDGHGIHNPGLSGWQRLLVTACARLGDLDRAREVAADQHRRAERYGTLSGIGAARRSCADVEPDPHARVTLLDSAVRMLERVPAPYERACALTELAEALDAGGRDAVTAGRRAEEAAETCSADALVRRARAALSRSADAHHPGSSGGTDRSSSLCASPELTESSAT